MPRQKTGANFNLEHYVEIISLMQAKNYDFRLIGDSIEGDKIAFMRHDIDLSLSAAETMAEVDNQCGIRSTFYFMLRSNFYNLFSPEAKRVLYRVSNLGHRIELHFVAWDTDASEECDPYRLEEAIQNEFLMGIYYYGDLFYKTVSFHHPPKGVLGLKLANYVNAYEDMYFRNIKYLSESLQRWREGDLYQIIEENRYDKLQILIHPVLWVLGSYSIKATMKSFMAAQRSTWERFIREDWIPY